MDDRLIRKHEQRGYSRGYQAGLRRRDHELRQLQRELDGAVAMRRERIFCAVINGLLSSGNTSRWKVGGKRIHNAESYTELAKIFVDEAIGQL